MMREETGNRNCLGFISHVKDSEFAINYNEKLSNECQNKNDKIHLCCRTITQVRVWAID